MTPVSNTRCEATTKKHGTQCVNWGATWNAFTKQMLCHLHHPDATYRQQVAAKRLTRTQRRNHRMANKSPNRGPLHSLSVVNHGPLGVAGSAPHYFDEDAPTDGTTYFGLDAPFSLPMTAGKGEPPVSSRRRD